MSSEVTLSKTQFAARINVSGPRVSQYIKEGKIPDDALEGTGVRARIIVAKAEAALAETLNVDQSFSTNGKAKRNLARGKTSGSQVGDKTPSIVDQIEREKLEQQQIRTAQMRREEALAVGQYIVAAEADARIKRAATTVLATIESRLGTIADALAAELQVSRRDALIVLQKSFRALRTAGAETHFSQADAEEATRQVQLSSAAADMETVEA